MADRTEISWADATWNPIRGTSGRWACQRVSPGCDHCYAATMNRRFGGPDYAQPGQPLNDEVVLDERALEQPLHWRRPRRVFVCSMTDLFGDWVPIETIARMWRVMAWASQHQFLILTKRPGRMARVLLSEEFRPLVACEPWPTPNVWLGTSIELDRFAWRANALRAAPAAVRFISAEPLLSPLDSLVLREIDWVIAGGESGAGFRPLDLDWVRDLRDRCQASGVAFHYKQQGGRTHAAGGRMLDGRTHDEFPRALVGAAR